MDEVYQITAEVLGEAGQVGPMLWYRRIRLCIATIHETPNLFSYNARSMVSRNRPIHGGLNQYGHSAYRGAILHEEL